MSHIMDQARESVGRNGAPKAAPYPPEQRGDADEREHVAETISPEAADPAGWPVLGDAALTGLPGEIVRAIGPTTEAHPAALLGQLLVAFGSMIGRTAHFQVEDDWHYLNEYLVLVGDSSKARKGVSWGRILKVVEGADPEWAEGRIIGGLSSGEGLISCVRDGRPGGAGQAADSGEEDKRLLVQEGEFASVLKQLERHGNTLSAVVRNAWDGRRLQTATKEPLIATGAHVSIIAHCTRAEVTRLLSSTEAANGFANRFLWLCVRRVQLLPDGAALDAPALRPLQDRFKTAADFAREVKTLRRDDAARELWHKVYGPLSEGRPGLAGSLLARAEAHVMRLACLYALLDESCIVGAKHLTAALALWRYAEESVLFVWGDALGDATADRILDGLREALEGLTREAIRKLFSNNRSSGEIERALALLAKLKMARRGEKKAAGGRPAEVWHAC
jgi:hypothetical protein